MNQIIFSEHENVKNIKKNTRRIFKFLLYISIVLIIGVISYLSYFFYSTNKKENISQSLLTSFNLKRLYSKNDYTTVLLNSNENYIVIGTLEIPSIKISYPILSDINDELLKIAPCRFYGPYPNEIGNLCIAGHNYDDNRFFSNLHKLNIEDEINIYDFSNSLIKYYVYDKYETNKNDTSCTSQDTDGNKEITLVTCNNFNGNRLIIKAKE